MYAYVIFAFICEVAAIQSEDFNVGTVLFSSSDIKKKRWTRTELGLIRARRHFQEVLPPLNIINVNEDFINSMLGYFKDTYSSVKSEAKDSKADSIMNAALSDVLGGYLKTFVLPITKFAYYGGTVSQEDASKLFKLYDEIKRSLDTDGRAWRSPNTNLLNSVAINISPLIPAKTRGIKDPCDTLAYFEKTDAGLVVPVPDVNWNGNTASMFVPLKNQSLIPLNSLNDECLIKYYNAATNCIGDGKLDDQAQFESRFQNWLAKEVVPHLNDENFYPALGSVLALVNRTTNLVDTVIELYEETNRPIIKKTTIAGIPIDLSSKKTMVITVIIILEVAWCIPTLCYMLYRRMKRNKKSSVNIFVDKGGKKKKRFPCFSVSTQLNPNKRSQETMCKSQSQNKSVQKIKRTKHQGVTLVQQPWHKSENLEAQYSTLASKSGIVKGKSYNHTQKSLQNLRPKTYEEPICLKNSLKIKTSVVETQKSSTSRELFSCIPDKSNSSSTSVFRNLDLGPTKTVTIFDDRFKTKEILKNEYETTEAQTRSSTDVTNSTKETCVEKKNSKIGSIKEHAKPVKTKESSAKYSPTFSKTDTKVQPKNQPVNDSKSRGGLKLTSGNPYLEITIDRPQRHISLDFSEVPVKVKHSKIPKPALNNSEPQSLNLVTKTTHVPLSSKRKSCIPQRKKERTADDIIIKSNKSQNNSSLNLTL